MIGPDKGDGSFQKTRDLSIRLGVQDKVEFPGRVAKKEVPSCLQKGDIFINTTNIDNTPVSVMEAMTCGLCVVSTNVGGIPFLLEDGLDALLVPPSMPDAMSSAVRRILSEPDLAEQLSSHAHQRAAQFDWKIILPIWEYLLESTAGVAANG